MEWLWSTQVEIHLESSLELHACGWHMLRSILYTGWYRVWSTNVEMHFVSLLAWEGLTCWYAFFVLARKGHKVNTCWHSFYVPAVMGYVCPSLRICWHGMGLCNTKWVTYCVFARMGWVWSTHVEMHFVSSLAWKGFGQYMLRCILCPPWHGIDLVNISSDTFCVLAGMGRVCSTHVSMDYLSSLAWDCFC